LNVDVGIGYLVLAEVPQPNFLRHLLADWRQQLHQSPGICMRDRLRIELGLLTNQARYQIWVKTIRVRVTRLLVPIWFWKKNIPRPGGHVGDVTGKVAGHGALEGL